MHQEEWWINGKKKSSKSSKQSKVMKENNFSNACFPLLFHLLLNFPLSLTSNLPKAVGLWFVSCFG
jgi:hypothetical protein